MKKTKKEWKPDGYIKSALRKIWRWSPYRRDCLREGVCRNCHIDASKAKLYADHILPVVDTKKGFQGWDCYIERLFTRTGLQPLCAECHKLKSKEENRLRRLYKKRAKNGN